jgi:hypothetical protein
MVAFFDYLVLDIGFANRILKCLRVGFKKAARPETVLRVEEQCREASLRGRSRKYARGA